MHTLALIGLGKMGGNMARRLTRAGLAVRGFDTDRALCQSLESEGALTAASSLADAVESLPTPRLVWMMLPAGAISEAAFDTLLQSLAAGDVVIDGGNANYKDSMRRGVRLAERGIEFIDVGVSGGVWGLQNGYCLMAGGSEAALSAVRPVFEALAPAKDRGWLHCGPVGAGHYTKMIHNGVEYGMMQAMAEGFALLDAKKEFELPIKDIAELWRHGSVVRSWLLDLTASALQDPAKFEAIAPYVADSGEGRWTVDAAVEQGIPAPVLATALMMRFATQGQNDYAAKLLALMRQGFGGHAVKAA